MKHHPMTDRFARSSLDVLHTILTERYSNVEDFLRRVGWTEGDLETWLGNPNGNLFLEAVTFLLTALQIPGAEESGPSLPGMGDAESDRDYSSRQASTRAVREQPARSGYGSPSAPASNLSDGAPLGDADAVPVGQVLSLLRWVKLALLDAGALEWDDVLYDHRKMEEAYRLRRPKV